MKLTALKSICGWVAICTVMTVFSYLMFFQFLYGDKYKNAWAPADWLAVSPDEISEIELRPLSGDSTSLETISKSITISSSNVLSRAYKEMRGQYEWESFLPQMVHWGKNQQLLLVFKTASKERYDFVLELHWRYPVIHYSGLRTNQLWFGHSLGGQKASHELHGIITQATKDLEWHAKN